MCSSWILFVTVLCFVDSCASAIQLELVLASDVLAFPVFETPVSRMLAWEHSLLHCMAAAMGVSNFRLAFLMMSLCTSSLGTIEYIHLNFLACSSFGFSIAHSCFSLLWAAFPILTKRRALCDLDVMSFEFSSVSTLLGGVSFYNVNFCETRPRNWQISVSVDIPIVNSFFFFSWHV